MGSLKAQEDFPKDMSPEPGKQKPKGKAFQAEETPWAKAGHTRGSGLAAKLHTTWCGGIWDQDVSCEEAGHEGMV